MRRILGAARAAGTVVVVSLALAALPAPAAAQFPPDSLTNLKVFPDSISVRGLMGYMRGFTRALGVRCSHCHVGEEGQPLSEYDFAADDKPAKLKARTMLRMVAAINGEHLAGLVHPSNPPVRVQCYTCHRGVAIPRTLQDELLIAYDDGGLDALVARYRELRQQYYGAGSYDFGREPLVDVGGQLLQSDAAAAVGVFRLGVEMFPDAWQSYFNLGLGLQQTGDRDGAIEAYHRALEINPRARGVQQRLDELGG